VEVVVSDTEPAAPEPWATKNQACEHAQCSMPTLEALIKTGQLPAYRFGARSVRVRLSDLDALMQPVTVEKLVAS
jgi:excisionase family DNA binding protein